MIEIYSKDNCSFCVQAKQLLRIHGKEYVEYKLDEDFTREILLSKFPEAKSYPVIVVDGFIVSAAVLVAAAAREGPADRRVRRDARGDRRVGPAIVQLDAGKTLRRQEAAARIDHHRGDGDSLRQRGKRLGDLHRADDQQK